MTKLIAGLAAALLAVAPALAAEHPGAPKKLSIVVVGDLIGPDTALDVRNTPELAALAKIMRAADAGFGNQEGSMFDPATFTGSPAAENGGGLPLFSPKVAATYKDLGISLVSKANNHAVDFGVEGLLASADNLTAAGITHAGSGRSESEARAPAYLQTPAGRIALVATASTFPGLSPAADATRRGDLQLNARAGQSVLRTRRINLVTQPEFKALRSVAQREAAHGPLEVDPAATMLRIGEENFQLSEQSGLHYEMNSTDRERILAAIATARENAAAVVFSIHAHETGSGGSEDPAPADFLPELFHAAIDRGADVVVRHGPHALKGIEIYKGRPIFYGMASLFFEVGYPNGRMPYMVGNERREAELPRTWYESAIAVSDFEEGLLQQIRLYPLMLSLAAANFGQPRLATGPDAQRILGWLQRTSEPYGVHVEIKGDVGVVKGPFPH